MPVQTTFPETMRQGLPGMVNRMVDYNEVTRSAEAVAIPACRAVSQGASDIGCALGGTAAGFIGITTLDPTVVPAVGVSVPDGGYPPYNNVGVLTKGEMFATATTAVTAGDGLFFVAATGVLTNVGTDVAVAGGRWKYTRLANELNVVQLGIQR